MRRVFLPAICALFVICTAAAVSGQEYAPITVEQRLADLEQRIAAQEQSSDMVVTTDVPTDGMFDVDPLPSSSWMIDYELIPGELQFKPSPNAQVDDGDGVANRLVLAYERPTGNGFRFDFWGFDEEDSPATHEVEIENAGLFSFDLTKRLYFDRTELLLGVGIRGLDLEFSREYYILYYGYPFIGGPYPLATIIDDYALNSSSYRQRFKFEGGGLGAFTEWRHPLYANPNNEIAFIGRGAASLVRGEWDTDGDAYVWQTDPKDTIAILEAALGLEYRRRCGRLNDHSWYLRIEPEIQRWDSSWLQNNLGSSLNFIGTKIGLGFAW